MIFNPELMSKKKKDDKKNKGPISKVDGANLKMAQQHLLTEAEEIIAQEQRKKEAERRLIEEAQMGYAGESIVAQQAGEEEKSEAVVEPEPVLMGEDPYIKAESDYAIAKAEELERNREIDPVYEAVINKFLLDTEKYRQARREVFHRLEMDRGELKVKADKILQEIKIKLGRKYDDSVKLTLKDVLAMKEFEADREKLKQLFHEGYFLASQVEEYRDEMMRSQRRFRDTNDSLMRGFIERSADPQQVQLREVRMQLPVSLDFYLEETSEEDFRKGKAQSPVDLAVVESIEFFKTEGENVPAEFFKGFSAKEAA